MPATLGQLRVEVFPTPLEAQADGGTDAVAGKWRESGFRRCTRALLSSRQLLQLWSHRRVHQTDALLSRCFLHQLGQRRRNVKLNWFVRYRIAEHLGLGWCLLRRRWKAAQGRQNLHG